MSNKKTRNIDKRIRKAQENGDILLKFANLKKMKNTGKLFKELFEVLESY